MIEIGLVNFAPADMIIDIYDKSGTVKAKYVIGDDAKHYKNLMSDHYIEISFELPNVEKFSRGDYIFHEGYKFYIRDEYKPEEVNSVKFKYTLRFDSEEILASDAQFYYLNQGLKESTWSLTSTARNFIQLAADNLNRYFNDTDFAVGTIEPTATKYISFDNTNVFDALTDIAKEFECEWYMSGRTISLVKRMAEGAAIDFENEVSVTGMNASEGDAEEKITRMLALGSTRNIPADYRDVIPGEAVDAIYQKRLRIPEIKGDVIDAMPDMTPEEAIERTVIFEDIYPKRVGVMENISTVEYTETNEDTGEKTTWNAYRFTDPGITFKEEYILPGVELRILFQSGTLNGMNFPVRFNPLDKPETDISAQVFEIFRSEDYGIPLPNNTLKPQTGDEYVLYGFDIALVGDQYVPLAEQELYDAAIERLSKNQSDTNVYECPTVIQYFYDNNYDLQIGKNIRLVNNRFEGGSRNSRIMGFEKKLINKFDAIYKVGDNAEYKRIKDIENTVKEQAEIIESNTNQNIQNRKNGIRNTQNLRALKGLIFDPDGYFDSTHIKPNSIETMYLAVGAKSQDFTSSGVSLKTYKDGNEYRVALSTGYINHRSLWWGGDEVKPEPSSPKYTWEVTPAFNQILQDDAASYYIYVKAEKQSDVSGWYVTTEQLKYADDPNYYYLLMGVIYPVNEERRDISLINGMAYIAGGTIYGDTLKSINYTDDDTNEGSKYDLNNGSIRIGNKLKGLFFDSVNKVFKLFGIDFEFRNANDEVVAKITGETGAAMFSKGNAKFNADGSVDITGKIQSNNDNGDKVIIDPAERIFKIVDSTGKEYIKVGGTFDTGAKIPFIVIENTGIIKAKTTIGGHLGFWFEDSDDAVSVDLGRQVNSGIKRLYIGQSGDDNLNNDGHTGKPYLLAAVTELGTRIIAKGLPTSDGGLSSGGIWNDNGTLRIKQ